MAPIDGISTLYICADRIAFTFVTPEYLCFMSTGVRPKYGIFIDIVRISNTSAWMVLGKAEGIKVLGDRDDRMKIIVVCVYR